MICVDCGSVSFNSLFNIDYETLGCSEIVQCSKCGRYKFFDRKEVE